MIRESLKIAWLELVTAHPIQLTRRLCYDWFPLARLVFITRPLLVLERACDTRVLRSPPCSCSQVLVAILLAAFVVLVVLLWFIIFFTGAGQGLGALLACIKLQVFPSPLKHEARKS